jgi:hypothetical protein
VGENLAVQEAAAEAAATSVAWQEGLAARLVQRYWESPEKRRKVEQDDHQYASAERIVGGRSDLQDFLTANLNRLDWEAEKP